MPSHNLKLDFTNDKNLNLSFFKWLFETDNIELFCIEDPVPLSKKTLIYYTKELKDFFWYNPYAKIKKNFTTWKIYR